MTVGVICPTGIIINFNPVFCPKLDLVCFLTDLLFLDIQWLYYYINVRSPIIFPLYFGDIYLFPGNLLSNPMFCILFLTVPELFIREVLETFVILSAILLPIKQPVASAFFWIALSEAVWSASVTDC